MQRLRPLLHFWQRPTPLRDCLSGARRLQRLNPRLVFVELHARQRPAVLRRAMSAWRFEKPLPVPRFTGRRQRVNLPLRVLQSGPRMRTIPRPLVPLVMVDRPFSPLRGNEGERSARALQAAALALAELHTPALAAALPAGPAASTALGETALCCATTTLCHDDPPTSGRSSSGNSKWTEAPPVGTNGSSVTHGSDSARLKLDSGW